MIFFGAQLRYLRKDRRVTQKDLAAAIGVGPKTVTAIEAGRRGPLDNAQINRLSEFLALKPHEDRALREAARMSSYTARIPKVASPQEMRVAHIVVGLLGTLRPAQVAALESTAESLRLQVKDNGQHNEEGSAVNA